MSSSSSADDVRPQLKGTYSRAEVNAATQSEQKGSGPFPREDNRQFSLLSIIGLAYTILNSWTAMAASLSVALPSGGPVAVLWGIVPAMIGNLANALSMAEMAHVYPSSGGQYHWSALLSPPDWAPIVSWITGWFCVAGWWALTATAGSLAGSLITGMIALNNPNYEPQRWQIFLIYTGYTLAAMCLNIWGIKLLPAINKAAITWSLAGAATICIVCLACSSGNYQSGKFVFATYINETGWNGGVAWILGLLQASFGLIAYDAVAHMVEEMPRPHINAPRAMVLAVLIGSSTSFIFLMVILFCIKDVDDVITSSAGALLAAIYQGTGSVAGSLCLQVFPVVSMMFAAQGILTGSSRMTHAFARDGGLPFSPFFAKVSPTTGVPVNAVILTTVLVIIFGLIYIGSSSALNAILSSSVVFLNVSYSIPIGFLLFRGRHLLRPPSFPEPTMSLGNFWGPVCNVTGLVFTVFTTVFFVFPPDLPVSGLNMNYAIVVFAFIFIVATLTWVFQGRKTFRGPRDLGALFELARSELAMGTAPVPHERKAQEAIVEDGTSGSVAGNSEKAKEAAAQ
ncbi:amino acid transporter [Meredithblackwellia eburnea MCA 4105]